MRKYARQSDIPFDTDEAHRFLPWLTGIMAGLAALLLCLGLTVNGWVIERHGAYANHITITIPASDDTAALVTKTRELLQRQPAVESVSQVNAGNLRDMLKPWLGNATAFDDLPLPAVLEVTLRSHAIASLHYDELQKALTALHPGIELDAHERFVVAFSRFSAALQGLTTVLAVIIVGGLALMVAFTSRASLKLHGKTVQLLHSIGAEDRYIANQFQVDAFRVALAGAVPGCLSAGIFYWVAGAYVASLQAPMLPGLAFSATHAVLLVLLPLACGAVAFFSARMSVLGQLQRVL